MNRYVCIHGHFYQPPRENPWLEEVEIQDSAYPYHDWNTKIAAECYAPNAASRVLDNERRIINIVNNYLKLSFNFGPTLLSWMQRNDPQTYQKILDADKESLTLYSGHGNAIAQPYNHMILPLANARDKKTQIIWGIKDFTSRFKRPPEGMWLPEAAVDLETLDIMAEQGIKFTILAPRQAKAIRKIDTQDWTDVSNASIDPKKPYICKLPSSKSIVIFFYDGPLSQDVAFGNVLDSGEKFAERLMGIFNRQDNCDQLAHISTDGETYGHHHSFADMAVAYCAYYIESNNLAKITNYGQYLEAHPAEHEVEVFENSSWSCVHGVERWKNNCGCNSGRHPRWNQNWRAPLRGALDWLRENLCAVFEDQLKRYLDSPWRARDEYAEILINRSSDTIDQFLKRHAKTELPREQKVTVLKLLEMQRQAMLMYTSCGWFFDEVTGIETIQIMNYAARAIQLANQITGINLEDTFIHLLENAPSNIDIYKNAAYAYQEFVKPSILDTHRAGVHYAISSLFDGYAKKDKMYSYSVDSLAFCNWKAGRQKLAVGRVRLSCSITLQENVITYAALYMGGHNVIAGIREYISDEAFCAMQEAIKEAFDKSDISRIIHLIDEYFDEKNYSLWHLFRDRQREILNQILDLTHNEIEVYFRKIYENQYPIMQTMHEMHIPHPKYLLDIVEFIVNLDIRRLLQEEEIRVEKIKKLSEEANKWSIEIDKVTLEYISSKKITVHMDALNERPEDITLLKFIENLLEAAKILSLDLDLWKAQNIYFELERKTHKKMLRESENNNGDAGAWIDYFNKLGQYLQIKAG